MSYQHSHFTRPSLDVVIPGAKRAEQVVENIDAANIELTQEEIDKIDQLFPVKSNFKKFSMLGPP